MSSPAQAAAAHRPRSRWPLRWWFAVALMFSFQLTLIFWLSERQQPAPRPAGMAPGIQLAGPGSAEVMALLDPTLFALPHRQGFSGRAWLEATNQPYRVFSWEDQPAWLALPVASLGAAFQAFVASNSVTLPRLPSIPPATASLPELYEPEVFGQESSYYLAGELRRRQIVTPPELRSWTNADLLTNSVVQMLVNAEGRPVSAALLPPGCGLQEADNWALRQARATRFNTIVTEGPPRAGKPLNQLAWGRLIFQWHTVPTPLTNAVSLK